MNSLLGLSLLPLSYLLLLGAVTALYLFASEMTKKFFYRRLGLGAAEGAANRGRAADHRGGGRPAGSVSGKFRPR